MSFIETPNRKDAAFALSRELHPEGDSTMVIGDGSDISKITLASGEALKYTSADIDAKLVELITEWDAQEYARNREREYPTIAELTISLFDAGDKAALVTKRAAVKTKWPKDNSGPVE